MANELINVTKDPSKRFRTSEKGSALVIALFVLVLVSLFVVLATSRTAAEAFAVGNEAAEGRTFYAAQGSLDVMTHNFNKVFERRLNPTQDDLDIVEDENRVNAIPGFEDFTFDQELREIELSDEEKTVVMPGGPFAGLYAIRGNWRLRTTVTDPQGTQVQLTRNILNNQIPIFQFGVFYDDDLELFNGPRFAFGGRVHTNRHFFLHPSASGAYFDSRVTAAGHIVTQRKRNGDPVNSTIAQTWLRNASGVLVQLHPNEGSVLDGTPNVFASPPYTDPELPESRLNANWNTVMGRFDGNLRAEVEPLNLPIKVGTNTDLIELIRRGKQADSGDGGDLANNAGTVGAVTSGSTGNEDNEILRSERFANKTGIRVSLADSKAKLPGCATSTGAAVTTPCGVRLDGHKSGAVLSTDLSLPLSLTDATTAGDLSLASRGYQPKAMKANSSSGFTYFPTRVNGERLRDNPDIGTREVWIKIETVETNDANNEIITKEITEDILSLGMTEQAPAGLLAAPYDSTAPDNRADLSSRPLNQTSPQTAPVGTDSRSVIKIQRFAIFGTSIAAHNPATGGANNAITFGNVGGFDMNFVQRYTAATAALLPEGCPNPCVGDDIDAISNSGMERYGHLKLSGTNGAVVPFPIKMFDTREGLYYDIRNTSHYSNANFDNFTKVPRNGIMSMIDIDVANLRRFLRGDFDGLFPDGSTSALTTVFTAANSRGLLSSDVPSDAGWVLYVSDRRGDADFDGEFDMEDIYGAAPGNDGVIQPGEDLHSPGTFGHGILNTAYGTETERYWEYAQYTSLAAVNDHKYYRRGVRLINGTVLPGIYDSVTASNTRGFTLASENGVYVLGNYNATSASAPPSNGNTPYNQYLPFNTPTHIPASIVGDTVTILSNAWIDSVSFISPYNINNVGAAGGYPAKPGRIPSATTQIRFAMISGDTITSRGFGTGSTPNQGGGDPRLNGGLHNFKRFLENLGSRRIDYTGSLINLYNSRNNNGAFKCCNTVYGAPNRNWVFDSTFLDPARLPPGTPYFQYIQTTGFLRTND